jgi:hypothetical protein
MNIEEFDELFSARSTRRAQFEREVFEGLTARGVNVVMGGRWVKWPDGYPVFDYDGAIGAFGSAGGLIVVAQTECGEDGEVVVERIVDAAATYAAGIPALQAANGWPELYGGPRAGSEPASLEALQVLYDELERIGHIVNGRLTAKQARDLIAILVSIRTEPA